MLLGSLLAKSGSVDQHSPREAFPCPSPKPIFAINADEIIEMMNIYKRAQSQ